MSKNTEIAWCDSTFNPWTGCTKVSPGCANCYAEKFAKRAPKTFGCWGPGRPRKRTSEANWKLPLKWNRKAYSHLFAWEKGVELNGCDEKGLLEMGHIKPTRPRVFCGSMCDWLDDEVPIEWFADLLNLIQQTPNLDWLLLTKRPENFEQRMVLVFDEVEENSPLASFINDWMNNEPPPNVWLGTSVENQEMADSRIPTLLEIPAKIRFLSCEPLLGPVNLGLLCPACGGSGLYCHGCYEDGPADPECCQCGDGGRIDIHWVICGGESGPGARPMHPDWVRDLQYQCSEQTGIPFFFKQWGEWAPETTSDASIALEDESENPNESPQVRKGWAVVDVEDGEDCTPRIMAARRVGKKAAGRLLDGKIWGEFPNVEGKAKQI